MSGELHHFPLRPAKVLAAIVDKTPEERGEMFLKLLKDLIGGIPIGDPIADSMIIEAQTYYGKKRFSGGEGGRATQRKRRENERIAQALLERNLSDAQANKPNVIQPKEIHNPETEPRKPEQPRDRDLKLGMETGEIIGAGSGADKYERIRAVPQDRLAEFAAQELRDADQTRAVFAYKKAIGVIGPEAFRSLLEQFIGDIAVGDCKTVNKLGAVFVQNRLKPAVEAKRNRGTA